MKNKEKGITLVSLVVTVIVLIILAGVSINVIIGQDGIITKAKQAAENMEIATLQEQERLNELSSYLSGETIEDGVAYDKIAELNQKYNTLKEQYDTLNQTLENTTAEASQILSGQTAYSKGNLITGTMPNIGAVTATINAGESYTIPEGYHDGSGTVTTNSAGSGCEILYSNAHGSETVTDSYTFMDDYSTVYVVSCSANSGAAINTFDLNSTTATVTILKQSTYGAEYQSNMYFRKLSNIKKDDSVSISTRWNGLVVIFV